MDKDFFVLGDALKDVGDFPQHQVMSLDGETYDFKASNSVHKILPNSFLDVIPNFNSIILSSRIILTDKISSAPIPWYVLIVSDKLLKILESFNLPLYRVYRVPVLHSGKKITGYNAIHILQPDDFVHEVVFERSKFWVTTLFGEEKIEELQIDSVADLEKAYQTQKDEAQLDVRAEYFSMRKEFLEKMDLFALPGTAFPVRFYISSALRNEIERAKCTGLRFIQRQDWEEGYMTFPRWSCVLRLE
jgi:hypothetical protein